jgi:hypothetical protein
MAQSQVSLCNKALARIGFGQSIAAITDSSAPARACESMYEDVRQSMLRERPWPFAQRYTTLALVASDPNPEWAYAYRYPASYLKIYRLINETGTIPTSGGTIYDYLGLTYTPSNLQQNAWQTGSDTQGLLIYTDLKDAIAVGTWDVDDEGLWDPMFGDAFAWRLAYEIAPRLTKDAGVTDRALQMYEMAVQRAMASSLNEASPKDAQEDGFTASRN